MDYRKKNKLIAILNADEPSQSRAKLSETAGSGILGRLQDFLKQFGSLYYKLLKILGPVYMHPLTQRKISKLIASYDSESIIINAGSGPSCFQDRSDIINIDIFPFKEVDIIADATKLPFKPNTVDLALNIAMLEHVNAPQEVILEMHRVLKVGGTALVFVPFLQPLHAAPNDFYRWTKSGINELLSPFESLEFLVAQGPCSTLSWILQEWFSMLFSFGIESLKDLLFLFFMLLSFPIKYLDLFFVFLPKADNLASGYYVICKK